MYHPVPSSFLFFGMARFMGFLPLSTLQEKNNVKKRHKAAKFGISPTSCPGFWHNDELKHPERALLTLSWLGQSLSPGKTYIGDQRGVTWVRTPTVTQGFVGVFGSILVTSLVEGQLARAVVPVNLCLSFGRLGCCRCFETWRADGQH